MSGPQVDPVSGQPIINNPDSSTRKLPEKEKKIYTDQAKFAEVANSDAAKTLRAMVRRFLYERIGEILKSDPEAMAYMAILGELQSRSDIADRAVNKLMKAKVNVNP
jgi:hypothetical protein